MRTKEEIMNEVSKQLMEENTEQYIARILKRMLEVWLDWRDIEAEELAEYRKTQGQ